MFVDSHCHLDKLDLSAYDGDLNAALDAARAAGVDQFLCVGINLDNVNAVRSLAEQHSDIYASVGIHPLEKGECNITVEQLIELSDHPKVVAIGETGLDYYYSKDNKAEQQARFIAHLQAGKAADKPVIIHTRDAREDTLELMAEHACQEAGGVMHCFTESLEMAQAAMEMNFYISFSGIVTFRNADALRAVAQAVPMDRLLIETDSPWLAPVPYRGKPNEPKYVRDVAVFLAELKGISLDELAAVTTANFKQLFKLA